MRQLIEAGGKDLGFATTFQDENVSEIVGLYTMSKEMGVEFVEQGIRCRMAVVVIPRSS